MHELVYKALLKVNPHGRIDGQVVVVIVAHAGIIGSPCFAGIADKLKRADRACAVLVQPEKCPHEVLGRAGGNGLEVLAVCP